MQGISEMFFIIEKHEKELKKLRWGIYGHYLVF